MYCINPDSNEPIFLLNKQIGQSFNEDGSWDGMDYIDGAEFEREMLQMDEQGKKRFCVYICSEGGSIMEAMKIANAILKSKTPCDTYNTGVCASSAGLVFMCGRKRIMNDYSLFMAHPVSGGDAKSSEAFTNSISSIISSKSTIQQDIVKFMMEQTTWIGASDCLVNGICTEIEVTKEANKKYMPSEAKAMLSYCNKLTDEIINNLKTPEMDLKQITNKLGLHEGVDLTTIVNHIDSIVSAKNHAEQELSNLQSKLDEAQKEKEAAESKITELQNEINTAKQAAELVEATNKATELVTQFKERIGNKVESIELWNNKAIQDLEGTKNLLESLPFNKLGRQIEYKEEVAAPLNVQNMMMEIQNRTNKK